MVLDTISLRVAFAIVALIMLVLFYSVTFRSTRAPYCGWWCVALALFLAGSSAFLLNGTAQQYWANPLGNFLLVLGVSSAWAGARTLRAIRPKVWQVLFLPSLTGLLSLFDNPGSNKWSGGFIFLFAMSAMFGLAAFELWRLDRSYTRMQVSLSVVAGATSLYYFCRWIVYLAEGPNGDVFTTYFGSQTTTLLSLILVITVSFSMSVLSNEQSTKELATRATRDGLTGLLNRTEFLRRAANEVRLLKRTSNEATLILADLDHFKDVNDSYGHPAGDQLLREFAAACLETVRSTDLVGRYGGEEFILLLPGTTLDRAEQIAAAISGRLRQASTPAGIRLPTVSYGVVRTVSSTSLEEAIASADAALYRAKQLGRNCIVREDSVGEVEDLR